MSRLCRPSVHLSICNAGGVRSHRATKSGNGHMTRLEDMSVSWLPAHRSRPGSRYPVWTVNCNLNSTDEDQWGMKKCGDNNLYASNSTHVALSLQLLGFLLYFIKQSIWFQMIQCSSNETRMHRKKMIKISFISCIFIERCRNSCQQFSFQATNVRNSIQGIGKLTD